MSNLLNHKAKFGTAPVFLTAISTILGAVMFLRFGYAVGNVGFIGTVAIIILGHLVTIPTALAIAEIATNQKVEGGGEYFIISRSFGINIGASIGTALYLSQAISVAFYIIAFAEAFDPVFYWINETFGILITDKRFVSIPALGILSMVMLTKGADLGVKALYFVVATLAVSLVLFFAGSSPYQADMEGFDLVSKIQGSDSFFFVFAIVFPAFTGMTAGVGLSGDLKNPKRSIPIGTLGATIFGMIVYFFIAYKLSISATPEDLSNDQLIMSKIALWGPIIPIGLAAATISSALGSIMVAPRTMQALAGDSIFPTKKMNDVLVKGTAKNNEPRNATFVTIAIALIFVSIGDVNAVAAVISMFFMVTYGAICLISFLQHFAADPSYRPVFKSKWYLSLLGAVLCFYLMFMMNPFYAVISIILMVGIYFGITYYNQNKQGMAKIFQGVIAQLSRQLQVFLQKADKEDVHTWRPSLICVTQDTFKRSSSFDVVRWISHRYGFGTYLHYITGYVSRESNIEAKEVMTRLIERGEISNSNVYLDTIISPTFSNAVSQGVQMPSVSGKESNMFLYEFSRNSGPCPDEIFESMHIVKACDFDICVLSSTEKGFGYQKDIHIWITQKDFENASLMILIGFVITGHPEWKNARIKIFAIYPESEIAEQGAKLLERIEEGRLPISPSNIELIPRDDKVRNRQVINDSSEDADLTIVGFRFEAAKNLGPKVFEGYDNIGNILFVNSNTEKEIN